MGKKLRITHKASMLKRLGPQWKTELGKKKNICLGKGIQKATFKFLVLGFEGKSLPWKLINILSIHDNSEHRYSLRITMLTIYELPCG